MPGSPAAGGRVMAALARLPGHVFWPDDLSLIAADIVDRE
jgi:hypothetical protein